MTPWVEHHWDQGDTTQYAPGLISWPTMFIKVHPQFQKHLHQVWVSSFAVFEARSSLDSSSHRFGHCSQSMPHSSLCPTPPSLGLGVLLPLGSLRGSGPDLCLPGQSTLEVTETK